MRFLITLAWAGLLLAQRAPLRPPVEAAWELLAKGERQAAIRLLHDIIMTNPRDADARLLLGSVLTEDGERSESIAQLAEAVRLRPKSAEASNALGEAFRTFDDTKAARRAFEKAVALDPGFAQAQVNLGLVLVQAGEFEASAEHLDRAIQVLGPVPDAAHPHYLRAISLGAVFFGACTYIGNGPNFMVKAIAESAGAHTPGFFEYILKYTLPILIPIYVLVWALFLS